jgi:hypothetical protein
MVAQGDPMAARVWFTSWNAAVVFASMPAGAGQTPPSPARIVPASAGVPLEPSAVASRLPPVPLPLPLAAPELGPPVAPELAPD